MTEEPAMPEVPEPPPVAEDVLPPRGMEVELKLAAEPAVLNALVKAPIIADNNAGKAAAARRLHSVYYDTPDLMLHRRGVGLRVRKVGRRFIQTVKTEAQNGVLHRGEWEVPVPSLNPVPEAMTDPEPQLLLSEVADQPLVPVFATRVKRIKKTVREPGGDAVVELAFDEGNVETLTQRQPVSELELELIEGPPAALFRLAQHLSADFPLRPEWRSKSARGYALAHGRPPEATKASRPELFADDTVDRALSRILKHCFKHWTDNEAVVLDGRDVEGVHQMRVALRRLRSALGLFRQMIPPEDMAWLREETRWLAGSLGPARDWDVFCDTVLAPVATFAPDDAGLTMLTRRADGERRNGYRTAHAAIAEPRYTRFALRFAEWIEDAGWRQPADGHGVAEGAHWLEQPVVDFADTVLRQRHRKVLKGGRRFAELAPEARHDLRIQLKKLRYAADFFRCLYKGKRVKDYMAALSRLQDDLGVLNDVAVARGLLARLVEAPTDESGSQVDVAFAAGEVMGWHSHAATGMLGDLTKDWRSFKGTAPFWSQKGG